MKLLARLSAHCDCKVNFDTTSSIYHHLVIIIAPDGKRFDVTLQRKSNQKKEHHEAVTSNRHDSHLRCSVSTGTADMERQLAGIPRTRQSLGSPDDIRRENQPGRPSDPLHRPPGAERLQLLERGAARRGPLRAGHQFPRVEGHVGHLGPAAGLPMRHRHQRRGPRI